ncbi:hypothetical protein GTH32_09135 [Alteromonas sp. 345S023]|uniref:Carrier domain-containing protein n=1 Tax=Alteromonas profundi TaxID=2696062 RepID=A0A7X5LL43_9ALTE|nr:hypothetical protein [Alteromonas profundi]NDV91341.1 hypothetical protein [Alteromonas profundi]
MTNTEIRQIVFDALDMINQVRESDRQIPLKQDTSLYGVQGHLDSMDLVGLLIDIEESLQDEGLDISLSDDRAMSQKNSPFLTVATLVAYISNALTSEA